MRVISWGIPSSRGRSLRRRRRRGVVAQASRHPRRRVDGRPSVLDDRLRRPRHPPRQLHSPHHLPLLLRLPLPLLALRQHLVHVRLDLRHVLVAEPVHPRLVAEVEVVQLPHRRLDVPVRVLHPQAGAPPEGIEVAPLVDGQVPPVRLVDARLPPSLASHHHVVLLRPVGAQPVEDAEGGRPLLVGDRPQQLVHPLVRPEGRQGVEEGRLDGGQRKFSPEPAHPCNTNMPP